MREKDSAVDRNFGSRCLAPSRARKVAKPVDRNHCGAFERRNMECRGEVCEMMFYAVEFRPDGLARVGLLQQNGNSRACSAIAQTAEHQIEVRAPDQKVADLAQQVGATVLIESDMLDVG